MTLLEKNVEPTTTLGAPAGPGDVLTYTISYDCSGIGAADNCTWLRRCTDPETLYARMLQRLANLP